MKRFYVFMDGKQIGSTDTRRHALMIIRYMQRNLWHPVVRGEFSVIEGKEEFIPYPDRNETVIFSFRPSLEKEKELKVWK